MGRILWTNKTKPRVPLTAITVVRARTEKAPKFSALENLANFGHLNASCCQRGIFAQICKTFFSLLSRNSFYKGRHRIPQPNFVGSSILVSFIEEWKIWYHNPIKSFKIHWTMQKLTFKILSQFNDVKKQLIIWK